MFNFHFSTLIAPRISKTRITLHTRHDNFNSTDSEKLWLNTLRTSCRCAVVFWSRKRCSAGWRVAQSARTRPRPRPSRHRHRRRAGRATVRWTRPPADGVASGSGGVRSVADGMGLGGRRMAPSPWRTPFWGRLKQPAVSAPRARWRSPWPDKLSRPCHMSAAPRRAPALHGGALVTTACTSMSTVVQRRTYTTATREYRPIPAVFTCATSNSE